MPVKKQAAPPAPADVKTFLRTSRSVAYAVLQLAGAAWHWRRDATLDAGAVSPAYPTREAAEAATEAAIAKE
jgi:hypothetical protein